MSDTLPQRLRATHMYICTDAANEIQRLRGECLRLQAALGHGRDERVKLRAAVHELEDLVSQTESERNRFLRERDAAVCERDKARALLREACEAWDEAMPPMINQSTRYPAIPICWREAARAAGGGSES